jgi:hypothetical protein
MIQYFLKCFISFSALLISLCFERWYFPDFGRVIHTLPLIYHTISKVFPSFHKAPHFLHLIAQASYWCPLQLVLYFSISPGAHCDPFEPATEYCQALCWRIQAAWPIFQAVSDY